MFTFSKTIDGKVATALFSREGTEWLVILDGERQCATIDKYLKDYQTNPVTRWIHDIESNALPLIERDPVKYGEALDRVERMLTYATDVIKNRAALENNGLLTYGPITQESVIRRFDSVLDRFSEHVKSLEAFGITANMTDDMASSHSILATALTLSQQEKHNEKGGHNGLTGTTPFTY